MLDQTNALRSLRNIASNSVRYSMVKRSHTPRLPDAYALVGRGMCPTYYKRQRSPALVFLRAAKASRSSCRGRDAKWPAYASCSPRRASIRERSCSMRWAGVGGGVQSGPRVGPRNLTRSVLPAPPQVTLAIGRPPRQTGDGPTSTTPTAMSGCSWRPSNVRKLRLFLHPAQFLHSETGRCRRSAKDRLQKASRAVLGDLLISPVAWMRGTSALGRRGVAP